MCSAADSCTAFFATFVAFCLLASIGSPWYTVVNEQTNTANGKECRMVVDTAWATAYCRTELDCCDPGAPCSRCNKDSTNWQDDCSNCSEQKKLYNSVLSVHLFALLLFAPVLVFAWGRCCFDCKARTTLTILPALTATVMAVAVITFATRLPEAYEEDAGGCAFGPCEEFIGSHTITALGVKNKIIWFGSGYWAGVLSIIFCLALIPVARR